jgi:hypothetical protein
MAFKPTRPVRDEADIAESLALQVQLNTDEDTATDVEWFIAATGTVWTEIYDPKNTNRVTQVHAFTASLFLLELPGEMDDPEAPELAICTTFAGAVAIWEGYGHV